MTNKRQDHNKWHLIHPGIQRNLENMQQWFSAPDLKQMIEARIAQYDDCRLCTSNLTLHQGQFSHDVGRFSNDCWSVDIFGKMTEDEGCSYILSCTLHSLPKYVRQISVSRATA